jgi:hypothetical protein
VGFANILQFSKLLAKQQTSCKTAKKKLSGRSSLNKNHFDLKLLTGWLIFGMSISPEVLSIKCGAASAVPKWTY